MFTTQTNSFTNLLAFLPSDIVTAIVAIIVFLVALAIWRIAT